MFKEKLKAAMRDLDINQAKLSTLTGIGKSSISQYVSGKVEPTEERAVEIATLLGLDPNYFLDDGVSWKQLHLKLSPIPKLIPEQAARLMGVGQDTIRKGLQQGVFPWGYAIRTSEPDAEKITYTYWINARKFAEIEKIDLGLDD